MFKVTFMKDNGATSVEYSMLEEAKAAARLSCDTTDYIVTVKNNEANAGVIIETRHNGAIIEGNALVGVKKIYAIKNNTIDFRRSGEVTFLKHDELQKIESCLIEQGYNFIETLERYEENAVSYTTKSGGFILTYSAHSKNVFNSYTQTHFSKNLREIYEPTKTDTSKATAVAVLIDWDLYQLKRIEHDINDFGNECFDAYLYGEKIERVDSGIEIVLEHHETYYTYWDNEYGVGYQDLPSIAIALYTGEFPAEFKAAIKRIAHKNGRLALIIPKFINIDNVIRRHLDDEYRHWNYPEPTNRQLAELEAEQAEAREVYPTLRDYLRW